jgi:hypothetical protein
MEVESTVLNIYKLDVDDIRHIFDMNDNETIEEIYFDDGTETVVITTSEEI